MIRWGSGFWRTPEELTPRPSGIVALADAGSGRAEYRVEALTPHGAVLEGGPFVAPESAIAVTLCVPGHPAIDTAARVVHASRSAGGPWRLMLVLEDFRRGLGQELRAAILRELQQGGVAEV